MTAVDGTGVLMRIAEGLDVVNISDNEMLVQFGSRSQPSLLFRDTELTGVLGQLMAQLESSPAGREDFLASIADEHRDEAAKLVDRLCEHGILVDAACHPVEQYLGYLFDGQTRLANLSVAMIGTGPVGAHMAELLRQHGIGNVHTFDGREFDGPVPEADLVVVASERRDIRLAHLVNRHCIAERRSWILAELDGSLGRVGPLFVPGVTACYSDLRALADAADPNPLMARIHRRHARAAGSFTQGLPVHASLVAGFASLAAVHTLLTGTSYLFGRVLTINFDRMAIDVEDVLRLPRCPVCSRLRASYQPTFSAEVVTRAPVVLEHDMATR
ncbi:TOMM precursor leader peptide-binding protein [Allorhizocola rhizosphaerae]|uniref:TOMM precursor leader peptide-binding protein n=1 Tax=Allorhizocola rhizosphaerae TaxID=1872709 RepID=UPI000E3E39E7|nr:TOMM precursor leader peptide-binding protein [Allorhizocola rhizosphaerae]